MGVAVADEGAAAYVRVFDFVEIEDVVVRFVVGVGFEDGVCHHVHGNVAAHFQPGRQLPLAGRGISADHVGAAGDAHGAAARMPGGIYCGLDGGGIVCGSAFAVVTIRAKAGVGHIKHKRGFGNRNMADEACCCPAWGFAMGGVVGVAGAHGDAASGVVAGELIGCARLSTHRLAVA